MSLTQSLTTRHSRIRWPSATFPSMSHQYLFKRGDRLTIVSEYWKGSVGAVDSWVFQRTVDFPEECGQEPAAATKHYCHQCQRLTVAVMQSPSHLPSIRRLSNFPGVDLAARNSLSGESERRSFPSAESSHFGSVRAPRLLGSGYSSSAIPAAERKG